jgi:hypothetical protein
MTTSIRMYKAGDPQVLVAEEEEVGHSGAFRRYIARAGLREA